MWRYLKSAAAAIFGVQSEAVRQQDFSQKKVLPYIIAGIVLITVLVLGLLIIVSWVLG
ncbi:DUF2970 domain-containing protein [Neiella sp. HB171785]|uniref:DUF2970 domain-containing protein n=1 Tax=Neiella litorisoli TaxID=2771431 RepID=A0A8J6QSN5_9GAMM|nr:DUF2970 domain-containing protein [Neiella litorisoli]MBD1387937.1 DUF2970 domain-containing protein [Neiella litorisoli]